MDAKFSVQYCLARALNDRKVAIEHFEAETYRDPAIRAILPRIHAATYTTAQFAADNHFGAEVKVTLRGGATLSAKVEQPFGRTSDNPLTPELLKAKFDNCAARVLPREAVTAAYAAIQDFENLQDVRTITEAMDGAVRARRAVA
jgi:2-methylcitrate dehydratase PrpD